MIPQIVSSELLKVCEELDLKDVINPHATVARDFAEALQDRAELDHDTSLTRQLALKRVHVPARLAGETLGALDLPKDTRGVALVRGEEERLLAEDTELEEGDHVLFVLSRDDLDDLGELFRDEG